MSREQICQSKILIVDDEPSLVRLLSRILRRNGFVQFHTTSDPFQAIQLYRALEPDLVLLDLHMQGLDGFGVLAQLSEVIAPDEYLPIAILTGDSAPELRRQALRLGAREFIPKPFDSTEVILRIENLLETRHLHLSLQTQNHDLEQKVQERTRALEEALALARAANSAKSDFLARMSHELRTPLNSVIGFANVLIKNKAGTLKPQELAYLDRISSNGSHLLRLINEVLDLAKIEAGKMALELGEVRVEEIVYRTMEDLEGRFVSGKIVPRVTMPPVMTPILGDAGKLQQVLINLVGNALRFTDEGTVRIVVHTEPTMHRPIRIDVVDTGIGIVQERMGAIFEPFEQGDGSIARKYGGTGLGLSISRSLCERMGYRLEATSEVGRGSMFSIVLETGGMSAASLARDDLTGDRS